MSFFASLFVMKPAESTPLMVQSDYLLKFFERNDKNKGTKKESAISDFTGIQLGAWISRGATVDAENKEKRRAIHYISKLNRPDLLQKLLAFKPELDKKEKAEHTPLHLASMRSCRANVLLLLSAGADANVPGPNRWLPLHTACQQKDAALVDALLKKTLNPHQKVIDGWTALHYAARTGSIAIGELLLTAGLDPTAKTDQGETPYGAVGQACDFAIWTCQRI